MITMKTIFMNNKIKVLSQSQVERGQRDVKTGGELKELEP